MASPLDRAVRAGVSYLEGALGTSTTWCDFAIPGRTAGSTECVSAFVSAQLGPVPEGRAVAARVATALLAQQRDDGGWGYREDVPADCDSTAWVLLAAAATGVEAPKGTVERAVSLIQEHQRPDGGFVTYGTQAGSSLTPSDQPGWFEPEVSVTASALLALATMGRSDPSRIRAAGTYLVARARSGLWISYWWMGFGYPTHLALTALRRSGVATTDLGATERSLVTLHRPGGGWANGSRSTKGNVGDRVDSNAFSTSFALRTLLLTGAPMADRDAVVHSLTWLVGLSEPSGAEMLAPGAGKDGALVLRDKGIVTVAAVVRALHEARTRLRTEVD